MIRGITFDEQMFYSYDFAHFQNFFLNRQNGITKGCEITQNGSSVTIGTGYFIVAGHLMNVEEAEVIPPTKFLAGYNRIVYEIDLTKANTITEFNQGYIRVLNTADLIQEDLDGNGNIYQFPFCHFNWDGATIKDFIIDSETLVLDNIFADISANYESIMQSYMTWLNQQMNDAQTNINTEFSDLDQYVQGKMDDLDEYIADRENQIDEKLEQIANGDIDLDGNNSKILVKRANELPALNSGELGVDLDNKALFFGTPEGNVVAGHTDEQINSMIDTKVSPKMNRAELIKSISINYTRTYDQHKDDTLIQKLMRSNELFDYDIIIYDASDVTATAYATGSTICEGIFHLYWDDDDDSVSFVNDYIMQTRTEDAAYGSTETTTMGKENRYKKNNRIGSGETVGFTGERLKLVDFSMVLSSVSFVKLIGNLKIYGVKLV